MSQKDTKISILGDGGWGTTLSILLAQKGFEVCLWGAFPDYVEEVRKLRENTKFLPGFKQSVAEERVTIIATKTKEDLIPLGFQEGALKVYDAHSTGMISDLVKRLNQIEPTDWTQQTVTYVLRK